MFERLIFALARHFLFAGTKFFFGIGAGPSKGQENAAGATQGLAAFTAGEGESDTLSADNFWKGILSGNQQTISTLLGPQINAITGGAQQNKDTTAQFSNRSGGTNASIQATTDNTRGAIQNLVGNTTSAAVSQLGNTGTNLLGQSLEGSIAQFGEQSTIHGEHAGQINDIFNSITSLASSLFGGASKAATSTAADTDASASGGYNANNTAVSDEAPSGGYGIGSVPGTTGFSPATYYSLFG